MEVLAIVPDLEHQFICVSIFLINKTRIIAFDLCIFCVVISMREYKVENVLRINSDVIANHINADSDNAYNKQGS